MAEKASYEIEKFLWKEPLQRAENAEIMILVFVLTVLVKT